MKSIVWVVAISNLLSFQTICPEKLDGTSWQGKAMIPNATAVIIKFSEKGLMFYDVLNPKQLIGLATCEFQDGSFISVRPEPGLSTCQANEQWLYNVSESKEGLKFVLIDGPCDAKGSILSANLYVRVVEKGDK